MRDGKFSKSELAKPVEEPETTDQEKADYLEHLIEGTGKTKSFAELIANINKPIGGSS